MPNLKKILLFCAALSGAITMSAESSPIAGESPSENFYSPVYMNDIAAIVNNEIITMAELMREIYPFIPQIRAESRSQAEFNKKIHEYQTLILNSFIERILIVDDFNSKGGKVPEAYEKNEYENHIHEKFNDDRIAFANYLRNSGQSVREFKKDIKEHAIVGFVLGEIQNSKSEVSPAKIREYYEENESKFIVNRQIFVHEITLLKSNYKDDELTKKLAKISESLGKEKITDVILAYSDSPKMSEIGWVSVEDLIPQYSEALNNLVTGEYTGAIDLGEKICILFISDEKPMKKYRIEEVKPDIERILTLKYRAEAKENYIKKLREKAYIRIFI